MKDDLRSTIEAHIKNLEDTLAFLRSIIDEPIAQISDEKERELNYLNDLLVLDSWPPVAPQDTLCNPYIPSDMQERADSIMEEVPDLHGLSFLDFGCGEGYTINSAYKKGASKAVGYDISKHNWTFPGHFTTCWEEVALLGPYDVILIHDVIDHSDERPEEILKKVRSVRRSNGPVYIRFHPWCSRHACHLHTNLNKAYLHLVFNDEELESLGLKKTKSQKFPRPLDLYNRLVKEAGFKIEHASVSKKPVENFFMANDVLRARIEKTFGGKINPDDMTIEFVDMILS